MRFLRRLVLALTLAAVAGCGGGSIGPGTTEPTASAPDATAPPADATQPGTGPVPAPPPATTQAPRSTTRATRPPTVPIPPPAGGAESVRVPAMFVVTAGGQLAPRTITVPPFLAVQLSLLPSDGGAHRLVLRTPTPHALSASTGRPASVRIPGLRAGRYAVTLDGRTAGTLVVGGEVGP